MLALTRIVGALLLSSCSAEDSETTSGLILVQTEARQLGGLRASGARSKAEEALSEGSALLREGHGGALASRQALGEREGGVPLWLARQFLSPLAADMVADVGQKFASMLMPALPRLQATDAQGSVHVAIISDRASGLEGAIGSLFLHTTIPTVVHVITTKDDLVGDLLPLLEKMGPQSHVHVNLVSFASVLQDLDRQGIEPVWKWGAFGQSLQNPVLWQRESTVRSALWDNLTIHSNPMNLLRFYLPKLAQFKNLPSLIFMDDDVIVQGDLARLNNLYPKPGHVQLATCDLWRWIDGVGDKGGWHLNSRTPLDETSFLYLKNRNTQRPAYLQALDKNIRELNGGVDPNLHNINYWNYGFVKIDLRMWRSLNLTERFERWMSRNYELHMFPEYSLSYGLGLPNLALMGKVQCWDEVGIKISDGLGYITPSDYIKSGVSLDSLSASFALHWSGRSKPFDPNTRQPFQDRWDSVRIQLGLAPAGNPPAGAAWSA